MKINNLHHPALHQLCTYILQNNVPTKDINEQF